ncbi:MULTISPECIES: hypothetical protein [Paenibacillus]|uniref:hypothetical protein n=1 Tax=Paenibacillus TaxID=44249 RepID=UPI0009A8AE24|nr:MULTISPECIES: hypothetical protein [Paenibacillus]MCZ1268438.1 hypothetical protein [Paenibacillus tundrae]SLK16004.1 hypothetical protein SAMN06272722_11053 [Paenibacillus sp. RU5A]SOC74162.1 hypothetical protein SAMN05880581_11053 [Paenibacillus sp. RU26A]SOC76312.1 hypothetical protein SAMN05880586_11053 [Paenibacillus sp. RU5M]
MDKEMLFSLIPREVIKEDEIVKTIEEQRRLIKAARSFVSKLSVNRFLYKKLANFDFEEMLSLFSDLTHADFVIQENELYLSEIDIDSFAVILEEEFNLESMYELDNIYIENLLNGTDITKNEINLIDETRLFQDILVKFTFYRSGMSMLDTPNLSVMLTAKKALLSFYLAEKNVEYLLNGQKTIYNISILM